MEWTFAALQKFATVFRRLSSFLHSADMSQLYFTVYLEYTGPLNSARLGVARWRLPELPVSAGCARAAPPHVQRSASVRRHSTNFHSTDFHSKVLTLFSWLLYKLASGSLDRSLPGLCGGCFSIRHNLCRVRATCRAGQAHTRVLWKRLFLSADFVLNTISRKWYSVVTFNRGS